MSETSEARELDEQIANVQQSIDEIDSSLTGDGALDSEDRAAALTNREEQSAILEGLKRRREKLG
jgi:hypothetical protein